jgi:HTH-type transcriptional regulator / antitoxin HigA
MDIRPIKTTADHRAALDEISRLIAGDREPEEGTPEAVTLEVMIALVHEYEFRTYPIDAPDPVEAIKFRMEQAGLTRRDLIPAIGSEARVSEILNRRRRLTLDMIRRLHDMHGIPLDSLFGQYELATDHEPAA